MRRAGLSFCCLFALWLGAGFAPAAERPAGWAQPVAIEHAENFFRVTPDFYRSAQPNKEAMQAYAAFGIATVINLRNFHDDVEEASGTSLHLRRVGVNTWDIEEDEVVEALALILTSPKPVLLHCMHGADRTGLVTAVYRVTQQGWTKAEAEREMIEGGFGYHSVWKNIPEWLAGMDPERLKQLVDKRVQALGGRRN